MNAVGLRGCCGRLAQRGYSRAGGPDDGDGRETLALPEALINAFDVHSLHVAFHHARTEQLGDADRWLVFMQRSRLCRFNPVAFTRVQLQNIHSNLMSDLNFYLVSG